MVDHYRVLGISRDASCDEIKAAFRRLALKFHPDRHANASKSEQRIASESFRQVKEAYEVLGNDKQREIYNRSGPRYSNPAAGASSSSYSAAHAARSAYARAAQQNREWQYQHRYTSSSDGYSRTDWSYRGNYAGARKNYDYGVRWNTYHPSDGPKFMLRTTLFGMAVVTILLADSIMNSAWRNNNTGVILGQKSYEEMLERLQQEKRARAEAAKRRRE